MIKKTERHFKTIMRMCLNTYFVKQIHVFFLSISILSVWGCTTVQPQFQIRDNTHWSNLSTPFTNDLKIRWYFDRTHKENEKILIKDAFTYEIVSRGFVVKEDASQILEIICEPFISGTDGWPSIRGYAKTSFGIKLSNESSEKYLIEGVVDGVVEENDPNLISINDKNRIQRAVASAAGKLGRQLVLSKGALSQPNIATLLSTISSSDDPIDYIWVIVMGTNTYQDRRIPSLRFAENDALKFKNALEKCGYAKLQTKILLGEKCTQRNIRMVLGEDLARNAKKDDLVIIFFSGHGAPEADMTGRAVDGYIKYLIPYDANKDRLFSTAIPMSEIATYFERIAARRIIFFADTCYSGASGGKSFVMGGQKAIGLSERFLDQIVQGEGRVILTASNVNEVAIEDEKLKHGVFTYYLLEGLEGKADKNKDGQITFTELKTYIDKYVPPHARKMGANQNPVMKGQLIGDIVLRKIDQ